MSGLVGRGRHYLRVDGRATLPVGAHVVPPAGPDWPWRVGPEAFERAFAGMAAAGLDAARIDLLWAALEPAAGVFDEALRGETRMLKAVLVGKDAWVPPGGRVQRPASIGVGGRYEDFADGLLPPGTVVGE